MRLKDIFNFKFWGMGETVKDSLFPPLSDCSKVIGKNGEPQIKLHLPEGESLPRDKQDLLLAMAIVGEDLSNMEGFEPERFGIDDFKSPQLTCKIKGIDVSVIVKVSRVPQHPPLLTNVEKAMREIVPNLYYAQVELMPCGIQDGSEAFFVNYRGLEKV